MSIKTCPSCRSPNSCKHMETCIQGTVPLETMLPVGSYPKPPVILPTDSSERKEIPIVAGVLDYFPNAIAYVAMISKKGNDKHNPGQPLHWSHNKSSDHAECIGRHLVDRGTVDPTDGMRHSGMLAWRALAHLEEELVRETGAPRGRGAYES